METTKVYWGHIGRMEENGSDYIAFRGSWG